MNIKQMLTASAAALALFTAAPAWADGDTDAQKTQSETSGPALWKVADEDTTIYLFGTVHTLPDDVEWNSGVVNEALASSEALVTEIDMTPENMASMGTIFQEKATLTTGQTLRELMTEEQRATYEAGLAKIGVPAAAFDGLEPWAASLAIVQVITQASGFTPDKGVETVLEKLIGEDVERLALETVEFQLSVFDELPIDQQILFLLEGAEDPMEGIKALNALITEWAEGDVEDLGNLMNEGLMAHPNLAERLLYDRNANWAEWIDTRLETTPGTVFIAVGAGHLAGEKSVQDLLNERDIAVERLQ
ncbi:MAG: TraB/GumN family protein [Pseudomonadota bacterium]